MADAFLFAEESELGCLAGQELPYGMLCGVVHLVAMSRSPLAVTTPGALVRMISLAIDTARSAMGRRVRASMVIRVRSASTYP
ncbi:hypothetical protein ABZW49_14860 [Nonomuraea wenchangensis]